MDEVLDGMARDLRAALVRRGLDPRDPPPGPPPAAKAFEEYQRRGGQRDLTPDQFVSALVRRVGEIR